MQPFPGPSGKARGGSPAPARPVLVPLLLMMLAGCRPPAEPASHQGYLEAEYLYLASPFSGALAALAVERGAEVTAGQPLFRLEPEPESLRLTEARQGLEQARAQLADLQKGLRPSEIDALQARLDQAVASLRLAEIEWRRVEELRRQNVASEEELDRARSNLDLYRAQRDQLTADLATAQLGGRPDAVVAAEAAVESARAAVAQAEWALTQKTVAAPAAGVVHDTLYRPGEWVAPGNPVVVLLPPANLKVRFFVPQADLPRFTPGRTVAVTFDGQTLPLTATVNYVSTQAEFTPPVIYSEQTRTKLVYRVEAGIAAADAAGLRPGQPVDVRLQP